MIGECNSYNTYSTYITYLFAHLTPPPENKKSHPIGQERIYKTLTGDRAKKTR